MPQVEIKFSHDINETICKHLFHDIEATINAFDSSAGICKSRAYQAEIYLHTHIYIDVLVMRKPHRNQKFMQTLRNQLLNIIEPHIPENCYYSLNLAFVGEYYFSGKKCASVPE